MGQTRKILISFIAFVIVLVLVLSSMISTSANPGSVMDFEGIPEGAFVDSVYYGYGVSGDEVEGVITVFGETVVFGPEVNTAMIFDATCGGGTPDDCKGSGEGADLFKPELGNVLIISKDLDQSDPDDADWRDSFYVFDFSGFGLGTVTVDSIDILDVEDEEHEDGARAELYSGGPEGTFLGEVLFPNVGNNGLMTIPVNISGVDYMRVTLNGSGAIDNVRITPEGLPTPTPTATITPTATPTEPTAVQLLHFRVDHVDGDQVHLSWATASEIDNYGFKLYRSAVADFAQAEEIHFEPSARGGAGNTYEYVDTAPEAGAWWYWLTDIDTRGKETLDEAYNPASVTVADSPASAAYRVFLPLSIANTSP